MLLFSYSFLGSFLLPSLSVGLPSTFFTSNTIFCRFLRVGSSTLVYFLFSALASLSITERFAFFSPFDFFPSSCFSFFLDAKSLSSCLISRLLISVSCSFIFTTCFSSLVALIVFSISPLSQVLAPVLLL